jgi:hypothetical protein
MKRGRPHPGNGVSRKWGLVITHAPPAGFSARCGPGQSMNTSCDARSSRGDSSRSDEAEIDSAPTADGISPHLDPLPQGARIILVKIKTGGDDEPCS